MKCSLLTISTEYVILLYCYGCLLEDIILNKFQLLIFTAIFSISAGAYASVLSSINAPIPKQSFETAYSAPNSSSQNSEADSAAQMKRVEAIMANAQQEADAGKLKSTPGSLIEYAKTTPKTAVVNPVEVSGKSELTKELESQMNHLNQVNKQYQQNTNEKIESLQSQNQAIQSKLQKLTQAMLLMNQQLQTMNSHPNSKAAPKQAPTHSVNFAGLIKYFAFAMVALLAVMFGFLIARTKKQS